VRALSREERELMIAANNGYLLAFDNLSGLPIWLSDALCRLATGGSFAVWQLYTDDEEMLFEAARPILLNGIEEVISRPDLGDRAIFLTLAPIEEAQRRSEAELWRAFEIARPRILGALLDSVVHGLRAMGGVQLGRLPRMADFAVWATAYERALWPAGTFARAYTANRRAARFCAGCARDDIARGGAWVANPRALGGRLRRAQTFLPDARHRDHILA
jgi:hypothetical protein